MCVCVGRCGHESYYLIGFLIRIPIIKYEILRIFVYILCVLLYYKVQMDKLMKIRSGFGIIGLWRVVGAFIHVIIFFLFISHLDAHNLRGKIFENQMPDVQIENGE